MTLTGADRKVIAAKLGDRLWWVNFSELEMSILFDVIEESTGHAVHDDIADPS